MALLTIFELGPIFMLGMGGTFVRPHGPHQFVSWWWIRIYALVVRMAFSLFLGAFSMLYNLFAVAGDVMIMLPYIVLSFLLFWILKTKLVIHSGILYSFMVVFTCDEVCIMMCVQFTRLGHTQQRGNAIMITSTITVVLFTTVVRYLIPIYFFF